ncbi:hypothetical protein PtB15_3B89 [Puccinia triticina]|nr:hypothetical protein PtB15_3B89 [Puccinia triticina]
MAGSHEERRIIFNSSPPTSASSYTYVPSTLYLLIMTKNQKTKKQAPQPALTKGKASTEATPTIQRCGDLYTPRGDS